MPLSKKNVNPNSKQHLEIVCKDTCAHSWCWINFSRSQFCTHSSPQSYRGWARGKGNSSYHEECHFLRQMTHKAKVALLWFYWILRCSWQVATQVNSIQLWTNNYNCQSHCSFMRVCAAYLGKTFYRNYRHSHRELAMSYVFICSSDQRIFLYTNVQMIDNSLKVLCKSG